MKEYAFSLQYPKPLKDEDLGPLIEIAKSGLFSRYTSSFVPELERELASYYQTAHAVTCTSGTAALHGCLTALDFPHGSEIIMTSVSDIGVVLPVIYENMIPVFADIDPETYNISPSAVEKCLSSKTKAVIAVHLAGNPADIDALGSICRQHNLDLIEDFSQAHGAKWKNKKVGSYGLISYGSFQQSKQITCGEGGVIVTDDAALAKRALIGVDKGWQRHLSLENRIYEFLAPNVRFNAIQAAVLKPQIARLDNLIARKRELAHLLYDKLEVINSVVRPQRILESGFHSYYSFPLYLADRVEKRDELLILLRTKYKVICAYGYANPVPLYSCVNALKEPSVYGKGFRFSDRKYEKGLCPNAEALLKQSFLIPFNENFTVTDMEDIANRLIEAVNELL